MACSHWRAGTGPFALDPGQFLDRENPVVLVRHVSGISSSSGYFICSRHARRRARGRGQDDDHGPAAGGRNALVAERRMDARLHARWWLPCEAIPAGVSPPLLGERPPRTEIPAHGTFGQAARTCFRICLLTFGASAGTHARCMDDLGLVGLPHVHLGAEIPLTVCFNHAQARLAAWRPSRKPGRGDQAPGCPGNDPDLHQPHRDSCHVPGRPESETQ